MQKQVKIKLAEYSSPHYTLLIVCIMVHGCICHDIIVNTAKLHNFSALQYTPGVHTTMYMQYCKSVGYTKIVSL